MTDEQQAAVQTEAIAAGVERGVIRGAKRLRGSRIAMTRGQALLIYLVLVVFTAGGGTLLQYELSKSNDQQTQIRQQQDQINRQQAQIIANEKAAQQAGDAVCRTAAANATVVNTLLDQQVRNIHNSTALTPEAKAQALASYAALRQQVPVCAKPSK